MVGACETADVNNLSTTATHSPTANLSSLQLDAGRFCYRRFIINVYSQAKLSVRGVQKQSSLAIESEKRATVCGHDGSGRGKDDALVDNMM